MGFSRAPSHAVSSRPRPRPCCCVVWTTGAILEANPAASRFVGAPATELVRRTLSDLLPGSQASAEDQVARLVRADGGPLSVVWRLLPLVGTAEVGLALIRPAPTEADATRAPPVAAGGSATLDCRAGGSATLDWRAGGSATLDKEERAADGQRLVEVQRLEGLALLIGNVTHAFNNLLTGILGYTALVRRELGAGGAAQNFLEHIEQGGQQAAELGHQLLAYLRRRSGVKVHVLQLLVEEMQLLLRVAVGRRAQLEYRLATGLPEVACDAGRICQALLDLVLHAASAVSAEMIQITVSTGLMGANGALLEDIDPGAALPGGVYVFLEVANNGPALTEEDRARLFDPPATPKGGRSPSLAAVREIARAHKGAVQVTQAPERGSAVRVLLPTAESAESVPASWAGIGPVLIVDDEATVSRLLVHMLAAATLRAETASGGAEALERLRADPHRYGLLLLDLHMPAPDGPMVLQELRSLRPEMPVVIMSGMSEAEAATHLVGPGKTAFLHKPFRKDDLFLVLRLVLGAGGNPSV